MTDPSAEPVPAEATVLELDCLAATDAGIVAIWAPAAFTHIDSYETWETELLEDEDITRHIDSGHLVPIGIGGDGAWQIRTRVGESHDRPAVLTPGEQRYVVVSSEPYLFVSAGTTIVSGYENIHHDPRSDLARVALPTGRYAVTIHLVDWEAEPGGRGDDNRPFPDGLPDFVILVNPEPDPQPAYRTKVATYDRPEA